MKQHIVESKRHLTNQLFSKSKNQKSLTIKQLTLEKKDKGLLLIT